MRIVLLLLVLVAFVPACGGPNLDTAMQAAQAKSSLDSLWASYAVAADQRDEIAFESLFSAEAMLDFTGAPTVTGKSAIGAFLKERYTPIDETGFKVTPDDLKASGDLAAQAGTFEERFTEGGVPKIEYGRFVLVAEKGSEGAWRIRRLMAVADSTVRITE